MGLCPGGSPYPYIWEEHFSRLTGFGRQITYGHTKPGALVRSERPLDRAGQPPSQFGARGDRQLRGPLPRTGARGQTPVSPRS